MTEGDFDDAFADALAVANGDRRVRAGEPASSGEVGTGEVARGAPGSSDAGGADEAEGSPSPGGSARSSGVGDGPAVTGASAEPRTPRAAAATDGDGPDPASERARSEASMRTRSADSKRVRATETSPAPDAAAAGSPSPSPDPASPPAAASATPLTRDPATDLDLLVRLVGGAGTARRTASARETGRVPGSVEPVPAECRVAASRATTAATAVTTETAVTAGRSGAGPLDSWAAVLGPMALGPAQPGRMAGSGGSGAPDTGRTAADGPALGDAHRDAGERNFDPAADILTGPADDGPAAPADHTHPRPAQYGRPGSGPTGEACSGHAENARPEETAGNPHPKKASGNARPETDADGTTRSADRRTSGACSASGDARISVGPPTPTHSSAGDGGRASDGLPTSDDRPASANRPASGTRGPRRRTGTPVPWPVARERAARAADGPRSPESCAPEDALGRTLAEPLTALTDLPSFDTSAMDGWAVSGPGPWDLDRTSGGDGTGRGILAGHAATTLADGHAVAIATGARVPDGATAVLRSEHGEVHDRGDGRTRLAAPRAVPLGQDIRPRGQECSHGEPLLPAGVPVTPAVLGLAAAAGYDRLTAYPRPRVEVLVLGDELLRSGLPQEGRIRDALGPMLGPWLRALGADVIRPRPLGDDADALHAAITGSTADVVLTTGGTASGPVDHVHPALRRIGAEVLVDGVEVRPGHPMLLARIAPQRHLVGLPGNPLAAVSGLLTLAEPLLRTLAARPPATPPRVPLGAAVDGHPHDTRLVPVAYRDDPRHGRTAMPLPFHGPAMLRGIAAADALAVIPPGGVGRGDLVGVLELPWPTGSAVCGPEGFGPPYGPGAHRGDGRPVRSTFSAPPTGGAA